MDVPPTGTKNSPPKSIASPPFTTLVLFSVYINISSFFTILSILIPLSLTTRKTSSEISFFPFNDPS
jgi:hypothetical protein